MTLMATIRLTAKGRMGVAAGLVGGGGGGVVTGGVGVGVGDAEDTIAEG